MAQRRSNISVAIWPILSLLIGFNAFDAASASHVYYTYDSVGRLSQVCNSLPSDGELSSYNLDPADNRRSYFNTKTDIALYAGGGSITSSDGRFNLTMQTDGNLVLYRNSDGYPLWNTGTYGSGASVAYFQSDGNFVLYNFTGPVWYTNTSNFPCARLAVQSDGNLVIYSASNQYVWGTGTGGQ